MAEQSAATGIETALRRGLAAGMPPETALAVIGENLLGVLLDETAISADRDAAMDATGAAARALGQSRHGAIRPLLESVFLQFQVKNRKPTAKASYYAEIYYRLLVGDLQIRRLSGGLPELKPAAAKHRAEMAQKLVFQLMKTA